MLPSKRNEQLTISRIKTRINVKKKGYSKIDKIIVVYNVICWLYNRKVIHVKSTWTLNEMSHYSGQIIMFIRNIDSIFGVCAECDKRVCIDLSPEVCQDFKRTTFSYWYMSHCLECMWINSHRRLACAYRYFN